MLSRRAYLLVWTLALGVPVAVAFWAFVPDLEPNMGQFLYWPATCYRRCAVLVGAIAVFLAIGDAFGRAGWAGRQR